MLVLEDHKKLKWAESKRIIRQLPFYKITDTVVCADKSSLFFLRKNKICDEENETSDYHMENDLYDWEKETSDLCKYDIDTSKLTTLLPGYFEIRGAELAAIITMHLHV